MAPSLALSPMVATRVVLGRRRVRRRRRPRRRPVRLPVMAAAAATVVVVGRRHRGEGGGERDGRDAGTLPSRGSLFLAHCTCSPFLLPLLLLLRPLHSTQSPQSIDCYFRCFSPRHSTANASGGRREAADEGRRGRRGWRRQRPPRSVAVGRSVIPTREDEREEESAGRTELTHRTDGSRGGRTRMRAKGRSRSCGGENGNHNRKSEETQHLCRTAMYPMAVANTCQNKHATRLPGSRFE